MRAADLVAICSAHGVDLSRVGGSATEDRGAGAPRKRTREEQIAGIDTIPHTARGHGTRVYRRPQWSLAEVGQAAQGMEELPWLAARYTYAGDMTAYWPLWYGLVFQAHRLAGREGWQPRVMGRTPRDSRTAKPIEGAKGEPQFYLVEMAQLVLDEETHRWLFTGQKSIPHLHAMYVGVEDPTWDKILEPRYRALQAVYERWLGVARGRIRRWIAEEVPSGTLVGGGS